MPISTLEILSKAFLEKLGPYENLRGGGSKDLAQIVVDRSPWYRADQLSELVKSVTGLVEKSGN